MDRPSLEERASTTSDPGRIASLQRWVVLHGNRYVLAAGIVLVGVVLFVWLGYSRVLRIERTTTPLLYLFSALVGGNITLITIVITIGQLILSRELRSPRELQLELESAEEYRESVEAETRGPGIPEEPEAFLRVLVGATDHQVSQLASTVDAVSDDALREELDDLTSNLQRELEEAYARLETAHGGVFGALSTILGADFSTRLNHSRWIRQANEAQLSDMQMTLLENLEGRIEHLDIARQYFKTLYIMQELADISRQIIYSGLVATLVSLVFIVYTGFTQSSISVVGRLVVVPIAVGIGLTPLALLASHILRITTVARRTVAITPFLSPTQDTRE